MSLEGKSSAKLSPVFSRSTKPRGSNRGYVALGKNTEMSASELFYNPPRPSACLTLDKLAAAIPKKNKSDIRACLELQVSYTQHSPVRRRFLRNPYTVTNLMDVWECDLLDVQSLANYNDMHRYIMCNRFVFVIYVSGPRKDKERPVYRLSVPGSVYIKYWP